MKLAEALIRRKELQPRIKEDVESLMEAIAHRDILAKRLEHLKGLLKTVLGRNRREYWSDNLRPSLDPNEAMTT